MPHVVLPNQQLINTAELFQGVWKLTRGLLAAGWKYKASGDATGAAKETTANASFDRWAVGGSVNTTTVAGQTGTAPTIGAVASGVSTITLLTGMDAAYSPGRHLQISGCANAGNNGTFRIITRVSATSVTIWNPGAISEVGGAGVTWAEKGGGIAASIAASGTAGAIIGRAIVTGLTGMVAPTTAPLNRGSVGDHLTIIGATTGANNGTFRITRVISTTSVEIDNPSATADASNGALRWIEVSPTQHVYAAHLQGAAGQGAWINLQGPSIMKIPVGTNVATGNFVKGEVINETTSGAQGVILGLCLDTVGGLGYIVVEPRLNGTGGGVRGWSIAADTITGATSGATIAVPNPTVPVEYLWEMVIWKDTVARGHWYIQCVDGVGEAASRFSTLATGGSVTAILPPGGPTGTFPAAGSWVILGTGGSNISSTGYAQWYLQAAGTYGTFHVMCANCIEGAGVSMDGSWTVAQGLSATGPYQYDGVAFLRCDDGEEGDVSPYVTWNPSNGGWYPQSGSSRTNNTTTSSHADAFEFSTQVGGSLLSPYFGWRRRGFPTNDAYGQFTAFCLGNSSNSGTNLVSTNSFNPGRPATQVVSPQFVKEPIWIVSVVYLAKMRKGTLRWFFITEGGVSNSTYANGTWIQLGTSTTGPIVVGPWDGQTVPLNG